MDLRPVDLPRLRDDLITFAGTETAAGLRAIDVQDERLSKGTAAAVELAAQHHLGKEVDALRRSDLFYVTPELTDLALAAAGSLPSFGYEPTDVPSQQGFAYFAHAIQDVDGDGIAVPVVAAGWYVTDTGVVVITYVERDAYPKAVAATSGLFPPVFPIGCCAVPFGQPAYLGQVPETGSVFLAALKATWLLMRQPLADDQAAIYDRASRRRFEREGIDPPPVRVISLRRPPPGGASGDGAREWYHSWIVRGHWRMQAYGVGRRQHRPVWIAPHVKGPADAPLLGGEKVYRVTEREAAGRG